MQLTQYKGIEGSKIKWKIFMDVDFIRKAFLKELDLDRDLKENIRFKRLVVKCSMNKREGIPGRGNGRSKCPEAGLGVEPGMSGLAGARG